MNLRSPALLAGLVCTLLAACATAPVLPPVEAVHATREIPEDELLDVGIVVFEPGEADEDPNADRISIPRDVRAAEARYVPYQIKKTLQETAQWGAVRVIPAETDAVEVLVRGRILDSDGNRLSLQIQVTDATGRQWLDKVYDAGAPEGAYLDRADPERDVFQDLYNNIANDMLAARQTYPRERLGRIREVARLRYMAGLSPDIFGQYLQTGPDGVLDIRRLPSPDDPMTERAMLVREREYLLIDTIDQHYENFHASVYEPYYNWRKFHREETKALNQIKRKEYTRKALGVAAILGAIALEAMGSSGSVALAVGGVLAFKSGMDIGQEAEFHAESIQEIDRSFEAEVAPMVVEVKGRVVELKGSAEQQFREWRALLKEIYIAETGFEPSQPAAEAPHETTPARH